MHCSVKKLNGEISNETLGDEQFAFVFEDQRTDCSFVGFPGESLRSTVNLTGPWQKLPSSGHVVVLTLCAAPMASDVDVMGNVAEAIKSAFVAGMLYEREAQFGSLRVPPQLVVNKRLDMPGVA